jgi:hypothetical protein
MRNRGRPVLPSTLERFLVLVESGRWPPRDPASVRA